jgi:hypothetical protein
MDALIGIVGVVVGSLLTYFLARQSEQRRWKREERLRWDERRLTTYSAFLSASREAQNAFAAAASDLWRVRDLEEKLERAATSGFVAYFKSQHDEAILESRDASRRLESATTEMIHTMFELRIIAGSALADKTREIADLRSATPLKKGEDPLSKETLERTQALNQKSNQLNGEFIELARREIGTEVDRT